MNDETLQAIANAVQQMSEIATHMERRYDELGTRIDRIVAAVESEEQLHARIAELEKSNRELEDKLTRRAPSTQSTRKTLPPLVTALLAKSGVETDGSIEAAALDAALVSLPVEQRIAVKSQMARAGMIG